MDPDEFHGIGGSYILDPKTGKRTQVEAPTKPNPEGGARDKDGSPLDKPSDALESAFGVRLNPPPDAAPDAPPAPASRRGLRTVPDAAAGATDTTKGG